MKILFATEYYHPFTPGGTSWSLSLLARELRRRGEEVAVVTPNWGAPRREEVDGVPVFRFPVWRKLRPGPSLAPARDLANPLFHLLFARAVVSTARRIGADVLHAQEKHALVGTFLAARWLRRPVFLSLRDYGLICPITTCLLSHERIPADCSAGKLQRECAAVFLDQYIGGGRLRRLRVRGSLALLYLDARLKGALVRRVDGVIGVSRSILEIYRDAERIPADRARVVYSVPPPRAPAPPADRGAQLAALGLPDRPVVLYVGKLSPGKGYPVFAEAARLAARRNPEACFVAVGEGEPLGGAGDAPVLRLGSRPHAAVEALYDVADVVVHPAVWPEPFSRVPLEAAAHGLPVVGTRIGGTPEAVEDKVTGLLVDRGDAQALAHAIEQLLADPDLRARLGRQAADVVAKRFAPEDAAEQLLAAYRGAIR
jgi:glycosyltransferase involved in cell wall biosynthesis